MEGKININDVITSIERLENEILRERKKVAYNRGSTFSYWLYEMRVKKYQSSQKRQMSEEQLKVRLEDIIRQNYINMEDFPLEEALHNQAKEQITEVEKWLNLL